MTTITLEKKLEAAIQARQFVFDDANHAAERMFAGFYEGEPNLVVDIYGSTLLLTSYTEALSQSAELLENAQRILLERFPRIACVVQKHRLASDPNLKRGWISYGVKPDSYIIENGITYALDLTINQDASFYLDTRLLRAWLFEHCRGLDVLNTFAYTGSLGISALAGGAAHVMQVDRNARYLSLARQSAMLNHLDLGKMKLRTVDFFIEVSQLKKDRILFDLAILDPPFFSVTEMGRVDQVSESGRMINKVRPLVRDGGRIVAVNNALFLSGQDYLDSIQALCADGYLEIEQYIEVPQEVTGFPSTIVARPPVPAEPFNSPTKIVLMRVKRNNQENH
jgi:23S rRNA (cytosine1962-C5)-methyltransferase